MKMLPLAVLALALTAGGAVADEPTWDKDKAAARLDDRAKWWLKKGGALVTDKDGDVTCLSCHTTVPYALARPALGRVRADESVLPGLLKDVDRRLVAWPAVTHMYEFDADKIKESKGTEAILSALILAWNDAARGETATTAATKRAFERLWETQRADGGWDWLRFKLEPWETLDAEYFGVTLAALAIGTAPGYYTADSDDGLKKKVEALRKYLTGKRNKDDLHAETWLLFASTKLAGLLTDAQRAEVIGALKEKQKKAGDDAGGWVLLEFAKWRYLARLPKEPQKEVDPPELAAGAKRPDGYATGLVVFTLLRAGVPANDPKIVNGLKWLRRTQQADGSWPAASINKKRGPNTPAGTFAEFFMSDAATAWAVLALLEGEKTPPK